MPCVGNKRMVIVMPCVGNKRKVIVMRCVDSTSQSLVHFHEKGLKVTSYCPGSESNNRNPLRYVSTNAIFVVHVI